MNIRLVLIIGFLLIPSFLFSADFLPNQAPNIPDQGIPWDKKRSQPESFLTQVGAFKIKKNAERLAQDLMQQGKESLVVAGATKDDQTIYRVYVREQHYVTLAEESKETLTENIPAKQMPQDSLPHTASQTPLQEPLQEDQKNLLMLVRYFDSKEYGEQFAQNMEESGYTVRRKETYSANGEKTYVVVAEKPQGQSLDAPSPRTTLPPSLPTTEKIMLPPLSAQAGQEAPVNPVPKSEGKPMETKRERISGDNLFGRGGFIHPFLSVAAYYTDNVFFSKDNKKDDFVTIFSPGIWLAVPHVYEKLLSVKSSDIAPGGFSLSRYKPDEFRPYQAYLFYNADIGKYAKYSSEDTVSHKLEGFLQYNLRSGLSFEVMDQYINSYKNRGTGISDQLSEYNTNLLNLIMIYKTSHRFDFRIDASYFLVNYDQSTDDFRHRYDLSLAAYLFYKATPKTRFFLEYEYVDITYEKNILSNSREHHYFGGVQWDITAKSKGSIKAGYGVKNFASSLKASRDFILEAQINHHFTPKTSVTLGVSRRTNETDVSATDFVISDTVELGYLQRVTAKITANIRLSYTHDDYKRDDFTYEGNTGKLDDDYYSGAFALQYRFREWVWTDAGYIFTSRDSTFSEFDYITNVVFFRLTGSL